MSEWNGTEAEVAAFLFGDDDAQEMTEEQIAAMHNGKAPWPDMSADLRTLIRRAQAHAVRRLRLLREVHTGMILAWDGHGWVTPEAFADAIERGEVEP